MHTFTFASDKNLVCALLYLIDSTIEKGSREVESLLWANRPVTAQIQSIYKHNTFLPALWNPKTYNLGIS